MNYLALDGGMTITSPDGTGIGLCSADTPIVSVGKPGAWEFDKGINAFRPETPTIFLNLYNSQWDTNYPTWNGGDWSSSVRVWSVNGENTESALVTLWEQAGQDVSCTVTLPAEMQATSVQPVDLCGQAIGRPIPVRGNRFTVDIGKNAPCSVLIDYEPDEGGSGAPAVEKLSASNTEPGGTVLLSWDENAQFDSTIEITAADSNSLASMTVKSGVNTAKLDLKPSGLYTITIVSKDIYGNKSFPASIMHETSGVSLIDVKKASAGNSYSGYNPIIVVNSNGMTAYNPEIAAHDNAGNASIMWHTNAHPGATGWIKFDFGSTRNIEEMFIWNMNQFPLGYGDDVQQAHLNRASVM